MNTERRPDDLLTARDIAIQYGMSQSVAESLIRQRDREGKVVRLADFKRRFIHRADIGLDRIPQRRES